MKKNVFTNFIICGSLGWCLECFWTGLSAIIKHKDPKLLCSTSVWMFPIYGLGALIKPISNLLGKTNAIIRGGVYTIGIFFTEYSLGTLLKKYKACPWDYSKSKYSYKGVIRLDYAPLWFIVGLLFEKILKSPAKNAKR